MAAVNGRSRCSPPFDSGCLCRLRQTKMKEQSTQSTTKTMTAAITITIKVSLLSSPMLCLIPWEEEDKSSAEDVLPVIVSPPPSTSGGVLWFVYRTKGLMTAYSPSLGSSSLEYAANMENNQVEITRLKVEGIEISIQRPLWP